jgi:AAHS family 4-hydroxybenzoate transporter-like MFS transporter
LVREGVTKGVPLVRLFADKRAIGTTLIWIANFLNVLNAYFVSSWLPTIVRDSGYSTVTGVLVGTSVQTGGVIGTIVIALILHRIGFIPMLTACFAIAATSLALLGEPSLTLPLLFLVAFLTGWGIFGGQPTLNALSASYYPTDLRSTGIGAGLGIGRIGAIVGPVVAGELMRAQWSNEALFHAAALPAALATIAVLVFARAVGKATPQVSTAFAARY